MLLVSHQQIEHLPHRPDAAKQRWWGLAFICLAILVSCIDMTIINVALGSISRELDASINQLQWIVDGFLIALAGLILVGNGLGDRFGRRLVFALGLVGFAVSSLLAALSTTSTELIGARVLMGASAALFLPTALSLIAVTFPQELRAKAIATWAAVGGIGIALGPTIGGYLVQNFGWSWIFLVNIPPVIVAIVGVMVTVPESKRPGEAPIDLFGALLSIVALCGIIYFLIEGSRDWTAPDVLVALSLGVLALISFITLELRKKAPLFDLRVCKRPMVIGGAGAVTAIYFSFIAILFLLPQVLVYVLDTSIFVSGLAILPLGIGMSISAPLFAGKWTAALGARWALVLGLIGLAVSTFALVFACRPEASIWAVFIPTFSYGVFCGLTVTPATAVIMSDVGVDKAGDGSAVNQLTRQIGGALGIAVVGSLLAVSYADRISPSLTALTAPDAAQASQSIEAAVALARTLPAPLGSDLVAAAQSSFEVGARLGFAVSAGAIALFALVALVVVKEPAREA